MPRIFKSGAGHDSALWPVLLLLLVALVPSAGVVWMMRAATENERLAVRQRLADAYRAQLEVAKSRVEARWRERLNRIDALAAAESPASAFAQSVREGLADSVVILDAKGHVTYPAPSSMTTVAVAEHDTARWSEAERIEFLERDPRRAAAAYETIAEAAQDSLTLARARQAQARALAAAGRRDDAIALLQTLREENATTDSHGRLLAADAELRLLELLDKDSPEYAEVAANLARRVTDYESSVLATDQRHFLQSEMASLGVIDPKWPNAEALAAEFVSRPVEPAPPGVAERSSIIDVWQLRSPAGRAVALVTRPTLRQSIDEALAEQRLPASVRVAVVGPMPSDAVGEELVAVSLAPALPGWRLAIRVDDTLPFDAASATRTALLLWTAIAVVALTAALALLVANLLRRQMRLARLKNDLVATVSHELKTPLASIRLLVDTLLDADNGPDAPSPGSRQAREYLELIARENARLTRLIDNFLTFSRMDRGKHRFDFQPVDAANVVDAAIAAVADRFDGDTNRLSADVERPLPTVGDSDALVTVVTNLLDNAWKYSDAPKRVALTARRDDGHVVISVTDNGIGLAPRAARKVFDRFYQVDQRLSRGQGGCGLGLSIVKYIVEAHGGSVAVESRPGAGSTFTVSLPANPVEYDQKLTQRREGAKV